jgi:hypothetical protein
VRRIDLELEGAIAELLRERVGTLCPSEAARRIDGRHWRSLMEPARAAGRRMAARGQIVVLQRGKAIDPGRAAGPIRFGRPAGRPRVARDRGSRDPSGASSPLAALPADSTWASSCLQRVGFQWGDKSRRTLRSTRFTSPVLFVFPMVGFTSGSAVTAVQVGYTVANIVANAVFGLLIYAIAVRKSEQEPVVQAAARTLGYHGIG